MIVIQKDVQITFFLYRLRTIYIALQYGAKKTSSKSKAVGRGRGAPAPVFAPPPGPHSNFQESHKKKLFMYNPEPITGMYLVGDCFK